jgi:hypothetical protein
MLGQGALHFSELTLELETLNLIVGTDTNARTSDIRSLQELLIHRRKFGCAGHAMLRSVVIHLDAEAEVHFVEADIRIGVLAAGGRCHGEQGALRHGWHGQSCYVSLRSGA